MVITSLVTGSWLPRTKLHLKEYYSFLKTGQSHLPIDITKLKEAHAKLAPTDVVYIGDRFDSVTAGFGDFKGAYHEDGLLLISLPTADLAAGLPRIRDFYENTMAPALAWLYSVGTPTLTPSVAHEAKRPVIVNVRQANDQDVTDLAKSCGEEVHFVARSTERTVYFADNVIFISGIQDDAAFDARLASELVFFREYEHKLRHFLDLHRSVWESIEAMRNKKALSLGELPAVRDRLLDYHRDLSVLRARLGQMDAYLDERQSQIDDLGLAPVMRKLEAYRFAKMRIGTKYMDRLWGMLDDYISTTVEITGLMYQENLQKEINFQQFIFLLGSVAAVITLGAIVGSNVMLYDPDGKLLSRGVIKAFALKDLGLLGGAAFLVTLIVFTVIRPLISSFKRITVSSLLGGRTAETSHKLENDDRPDSL
jgi:hypothetical protein